MEGLVGVNDYEKLALTILSRNARSYYSTGATDQQTLKENKQAFKRWRFRPKVLRDVSTIDTRTSVLGSQLSIPICVAATGINKMADKDGELASARAANAIGTVFSLTSGATTTLEEISANVPGLIRWYQLYLYKDRSLAKELVERAERSGFTALILTTDTAVLGTRYGDIRNNFKMPSHLTFANVKLGSQPLNMSESPKDSSGLVEYVRNFFDPSISWKDVEWLRTITSMPIILKGVMTVEMALEAVAHGIQGIIVSNHGGRQLDGVTATIDALPPIARAVAGRCEVYMDGGIRNGGDVAKAIALGAKAVFVGRPIIWGLACDGERGAMNVLKILRDELKNVMQLLGVSSIHELQTVKNLVIHENHMQSAL